MSSDDDDEFDIYNETLKQMMVPKKIGKHTLYKLLRETKMSLVFSTLEEEYVMKCIPTHYFNINKDELKYMTTINHPHILKADDSFKIPQDNPRFTAILMQRAKKDLLDYLIEYRYLPENLVRKIMFDMLNALNYLHKNGIWHRDIKLENIFVMRETNEGPYIVVADLGFAHKFGHGFFTAVAQGTEPYAAPELLDVDESPDFGCHFKDKARYCNNVDVFASGIVMYCLFSGRHPFGKKGRYDIYRHMKGDVIFDIPYQIGESNPFDNVSDSAKDLMCQMLCSDPYSRPSVSDVLAHEWFTESNEEAKPTITSVCYAFAREMPDLLGGDETLI